jgi:hypothetical protein
LCSLRGKISEWDSCASATGNQESVIEVCRRKFLICEATAAIIETRYPSIGKKRQTQDYLGSFFAGETRTTKSNQSAQAETHRSETGPGRRLREVLPGQHNSDPNEHAQNKPDHEAKTGGVLNRPLSQIENPRRLIFVHRSNLHLCPPRTTGDSAQLSCASRQSQWW